MNRVNSSKRARHTKACFTTKADALVFASRILEKPFCHRTVFRIVGT